MGKLKQSLPLIILVIVSVTSLVLYNAFTVAESVTTQEGKTYTRRLWKSTKITKYFS